MKKGLKAGLYSSPVGKDAEYKIRMKNKPRIWLIFLARRRGFGKLNDMENKSRNGTMPLVHRQGPRKLKENK